MNLNYVDVNYVDGLLFSSITLSHYGKSIHIPDFGRIGEHSDIGGLIGLDLLIQGKFIIDLDMLRLYID